MEVQNNLSSNPLWRQNLWYVLRPLLMPYDYELCFKAWDCRTITKPLKTYYNNSAVFFQEDKHLKGAKHMELKYFAFKEFTKSVHKCIITELIIPDRLTKFLNKNNIRNMWIEWY